MNKKREIIELDKKEKERESRTFLNISVSASFSSPNKLA